jgi:AcrR family transcriptional regulator
MGRRSSHKPDELRELILQSATALIEADGLSGLSAREIARRIGYSAGTLYNMFDDLDDIVLTIEARLLDRLAHELMGVPAHPDPIDHLCALAEVYFRFTQRAPKLWNLLFEHHMPTNWVVPIWYKAKLDNLLKEVERALLPITNDDASAKRAAHVLWAGLHGITSLATADKLANITRDEPSDLIQNLVRTYVAGLSAHPAAILTAAAPKKRKA